VRKAIKVHILETRLTFLQLLPVSDHSQDVMGCSGSKTCNTESVTEQHSHADMNGLGTHCADRMVSVDAKQEYSFCCRIHVSEDNMKSAVCKTTGPLRED
jgi:hypothetical protein